MTGLSRTLALEGSIDPRRQESTKLKAPSALGSSTAAMTVGAWGTAADCGNVPNARIDHGLVA